MTTVVRIAIGIVGTFALWVVLYVGSKLILAEPTSENKIAFVSSLFSALAMLGLVWTIQIQRKELSLQRDELRSTRVEFEQQNETLKKQRFESSFFNLLSLHHSITEKLFMLHSSTEYRSRDLIAHIYNDFRGKFFDAYRAKGSPPITPDSFTDHKGLVVQIFSNTYQGYSRYTSHYLNHFVTTIRLVQSSELIDDKERKFYYGILRSQLNPFEVLFLFYYLNAGPGILQKEYFDHLELGQALDHSLLADVNHSWIYDPPHVIETMGSLKSKVT